MNLLVVYLAYGTYTSYTYVFNVIWCIHVSLIVKLFILLGRYIFINVLRVHILFAVYECLCMAINCLNVIFVNRSYMTKLYWCIKDPVYELFFIPICLETKTFMFYHVMHWFSTRNQVIERTTYIVCIWYEIVNSAHIAYNINVSITLLWYLVSQINLSLFSFSDPGYCITQ